TSALPELKAKDFLTALIKMFNLYIEPNQLDDRLLAIEPRDIYYNDNVVDITNNLDVSKDFNSKAKNIILWWFKVHRKTIDYSLKWNTTNKHTIF
ncbi:MAG: hypothetical protein EBR82_44710, partial [Caulobacteraceae bacterium]|nr:hypothetical protein [Caulobacteraceae bacterium]